MLPTGGIPFATTERRLLDPSLAQIFAANEKARNIRLPIIRNMA
jgi:hypothetical protein